MHRLRRIPYFAESFDEPGGKGDFEMRHSFLYFFSLVRTPECFTQISRPLAYGPSSWIHNKQTKRVRSIHSRSQSLIAPHTRVVKCAPQNTPSQRRFGMSVRLLTRLTAVQFCSQANPRFPRRWVEPDEPCAETLAEPVRHDDVLIFVGTEFLSKKGRIHQPHKRTPANTTGGVTHSRPKFRCYYKLP